MNVAKFTKALADLTKDNDKFIIRHLSGIIRDFQVQLSCLVVAPLTQRFSRRVRPSRRSSSRTAACASTSLQRQARQRLLRKLTVPFHCARVQELKVTPEAMEELLVQLILDGHIVGKIDQVHGLLDMSQRCVSCVRGSAHLMSLCAVQRRWWRSQVRSRGPLGDEPVRRISLSAAAIVRSRIVVL